MFYMEQGAHVGPPCDLVARSSLNWHELPSLVWSHLVARFPDDQLADKEVGLLAHRCPLEHLLYALVGSTTSFADVVEDMRAQSVTRSIAPESSCFPQGEGQRLV